MGKKLRLLLFSECNRTCPGCCNNDFNLPSLPVVESYVGYDEIILTGGEPMLRPDLIIKTVGDIRNELFQSWLETKGESLVSTPIYMNTARPTRAYELLTVLHWLDGITLTLHEPYDVAPFQVLNEFILRLPTQGKSLRLNVFKGIDLSGIDLARWQVKDNIEWIVDCPLPEDEAFMRLPE